MHWFSPFTMVHALYISRQSLFPARGCRSRRLAAVGSSSGAGGAELCPFAAPAEAVDVDTVPCGMFVAVPSQLSAVKQRIAWRNASFDMRRDHRTRRAKQAAAPSVCGETR